ncbi:phosphopantetheine-binding protein [Actinomadura rubrisoli]|uniref:Isochorismatase n=1 Tax=Actinomadura rubrisoli TaxID=2530368 RepID=A0A4R5B1B1_9ACTN|nr:phosphopantetheine-binding protein [Actinomadura rubrisoli]TDD77936.1 isochorismatase [Actinomadura rubrisoli]
MERNPLTPERIRADVADVLSVRADDLTDDARLTDQGLDSIRLMTLIERWRAEGVDVEIVDLAERPTVAQWVERLAR